MRMSFNSAAVKGIGMKGLLRAAIRSISSAYNHQNFHMAKKSLASLAA